MVAGADAETGAKGDRAGQGHLNRLKDFEEIGSARAFEDRTARARSPTITSFRRL
jgi:hypothetical protein